MRRIREKQQKRKLPLYTVMFALTAYLVSLLVAGFDYIVPDTHDITVGIPAPMDFHATRVVENVYRTRLNREAAAAAISPQFDHSEAITAEILDNLHGFFVAIGEARAQFLPIISPFDEISDPPAPPFENHLITAESATFARFMAALTEYIEDILQAQVTSPTALAGLVNQTAEVLREQGFDEDFVATGLMLAQEFVRLNMVINEERTESLRQEAADAADVISFQMGQIIVREGSIIDEEAYLALTELGLIGVTAAAIFAGLAGSSLIVTIVFAISIFYIWTYKKDMAFDKRQALMLTSLYIMAIVLLRVMLYLPFYFTPIMLFAILCAILIDTRLSVVITIALSMVAVVIDPMNTMFVTYSIINGVFAAILAKKIVVRSNMWMAAGTFVLVNALTVFANYFLFAGGFTDQTLLSAVLAMVGGVMTITLAYGSLPIWESLFRVVTQNTLLELTDPNNGLLRRLLIETPGTYHHSLVVANLAEAACFDIEANHVLARVGAYYHDIGKMKYPQYFAENQTDFNPHDTLPPRTSVEVINEHVTGGLELARQHKLPLPIMDFIEQHHGTSLMKVFFHKEKMANPDIEIDERDFRYNNRIPQSSETAVVMLADTCEAAVRSVFGKGDKDANEIEPFVRKLIKDKLDDGQLNESGLSIRDLEVITKAFMRVFKGMHHERVPYPTGTVAETLKRR
ncbi:MAG: HDIG domain-containing protein [Clostridiales bacterium]|jgi:putative nucleotidyltransferase with HDIG domain|nr:HDIG domain-containing protein [Clostridiales bacterium]